jgi:hypothetical protein
LMMQHAPRCGTGRWRRPPKRPFGQPADQRSAAWHASHDSKRELIGFSGVFSGASLICSLDDLSLADTSTIDLAHACGEPVQSMRVLIVVTSRRQTCLLGEESVRTRCLSSAGQGSMQRGSCSNFSLDSEVEKYLAITFPVRDFRPALRPCCMPGPMAASSLW